MEGLDTLYRSLTEALYTLNSPLVVSFMQTMAHANGGRQTESRFTLHMHDNDLSIP